MEQQPYCSCQPWNNFGWHSFTCSGFANERANDPGMPPPKLQEIENILNWPRSLNQEPKITREQLEEYLDGIIITYKFLKGMVLRVNNQKEQDAILGKIDQYHPHYAECIRDLIQEFTYQFDFFVSDYSDEIDYLHSKGKLTVMPCRRENESQRTTYRAG